MGFFAWAIFTWKTSQKGNNLLWQISSNSWIRLGESRSLRVGPRSIHVHLHICFGEGMRINDGWYIMWCEGVSQIGLDLNQQNLRKKAYHIVFFRALHRDILQGTDTYPPTMVFWVDDFPNFPFGGICQFPLRVSFKMVSPGGWESPWWNLSTGALQRTAWQSGRQPWKSHLLEPKKTQVMKRRCIQNIKTGKILEKSNLKHPRKLTWNPKNWWFGLMFLLFQGCIFRFHVSFRGGTWPLALIRKKITDFFFVGVFLEAGTAPKQSRNGIQVFGGFSKKMPRFFGVAGTSNGKTYPPENYHILLKWPLLRGHSFIFRLLTWFWRWPWASLGQLRSSSKLRPFIEKGSPCLKLRP